MIRQADGLAGEEGDQTGRRTGGLRKVIRQVDGLAGEIILNRATLRRRNDSRVDPSTAPPLSRFYREVSQAAAGKRACEPSRGASARFRFGSPFSSERLWFMDTVLL